MIVDAILARASLQDARRLHRGKKWTVRHPRPTLGTCPGHGPDHSSPMPKKLLLIDGSYYAYRSFSPSGPDQLQRRADQRDLRLCQDRAPDAQGPAARPGRRLLGRGPARPPHGVAARLQAAPRRDARRNGPQMPFIRELVPKLGVHGVALGNTEADDLMASYTCAAHGEGMEVIWRPTTRTFLSLVGGRHPGLLDGQGRSAFAPSSSTPCWPRNTSRRSGGCRRRASSMCSP